MRRRALRRTAAEWDEQPEQWDPRSPTLVDALARLEVAARLRDHLAARQILDGLTGCEEGRWLLRQAVAAGLRSVADAIADPALVPIGAAPGRDVVYAFE